MFVYLYAGLRRVNKNILYRKIFQIFDDDEKSD